MKLRTSFPNLRRQRTEAPVNSVFRVPRSALSARGVALVITLILLAVITTLAIAFLAITHRETGAVDSMSRTTDAELAVDSALERAKAEILAGFPIRNAGQPVNNFSIPNDLLGPEMMVSVAHDTNRIDLPATAANELTIPFINPSVPVFVDVNGTIDDRFYLDLNRNGYFEETGIVPFLDNNRLLVPDNNPGPFLNNFVRGDPQWIGVLQDPRLPHAPNNRYIGRYAFMVLPTGRSLDINFIHNQALNLEMRRGGYNGYYRNQGVGPWEINLAAFLTDLNANVWGNYSFTPLDVGPQGAADATSTPFTDARELLRYRYAPFKSDLNNWSLLNPQFSPHLSNDTFTAIFGAAPALNNDVIDAYADGPLTLSGVPLPFSTDNPNRAWPGAASRRQFSSPHDFFDAGKLPDDPGFRRSLTNASMRNSSYDRYTFYRMLAQMGTDSEADNLVPENGGKINLNYVNVGGVLASDFISWTNSSPSFRSRFREQTGYEPTGPELFVNTVVERLLQEEGYTFTTRPQISPLINAGLNIPMDNPGYTPRIHQLVQLAVNILEATTAQKSAEDLIYPHYPLVFRPQFRTDNTGRLFITRYLQVERPTFADIVAVNPTYKWYDVGNRSEWPGSSSDWDNASFHDIPWIFGTRRGLPNFNEFTAQDHVRVQRYLQFEKTLVGGQAVVTRTNECVVVGVRNHHHTEFFYAYSNSYPRPLTIWVTNEMVVRLAATNEITRVVQPIWTANVSTGYWQFAAANTWSNGLSPTRFGTYSGPLTHTNDIVFGDGSFLALAGNLPNFRQPQRPNTSAWLLFVTNRYRCYLFDGDNNNRRLVDAFTSARMVTVLNVNEHLDKDSKYNLFNRTLMGATTRGVQEQAGICLGVPGFTVTPGEWASEQGLGAVGASTVQNAVNGLNAWFDNKTNTVELTRTSAFNPLRHVVQARGWQVDDPLVHFTSLDLENPRSRTSVFSNRVKSYNPNDLLNPAMDGIKADIGASNVVSKPWSASYQIADHDPGIFSSENWDFLSDGVASKYPNIGWLGRVHRGTPWQTICLKSIDTNAYTHQSWRDYRGNAFSFDTFPTNDWRLLDIFTVAMHPNQTRGRLSVNQTNEAAWSAVLAGINISTLTTADTFGDYNPSNHTVDPIALAPLNTKSPIREICEAIAAFRTNEVFNGRSPQFHRLGDLLKVSAFTVDSPYLKDPYITQDAKNSKSSPKSPQAFLTDSDYERIPQQIMSLLKVGEPRFVVYAWGQSLKPARQGVEVNGNTVTLGGPSIDPVSKVCNNYQVTGEAATRAVVRVVFPERQPDGKTDYRRPRLVVESFNVLPVE